MRTVGRVGRRMAANSVMASAMRLAGQSETNAGAMTEIRTQPGTASMIVTVRALKLCHQSRMPPRIRGMHLAEAIRTMARTV